MLPLWGARHTSSEFNELFKLQKKAIRIITNKTTKIEGKFQNTKPLFKKANILTIQNLYYSKTSLYRASLYRVPRYTVHGILPPNTVFSCVYM